MNPKKSISITGSLTFTMVHGWGDSSESSPSNLPFSPCAEDLSPKNSSTFSTWHRPAVRLKESILDSLVFFFMIACRFPSCWVKLQLLEALTLSPPSVAASCSTWTRSITMWRRLRRRQHHLPTLIANTFCDGSNVNRSVSSGSPFCSASLPPS